MNKIEMLREKIRKVQEVNFELIKVIDELSTEINLLEQEHLVIKDEPYVQRKKFDSIIKSFVGRKLNKEEQKSLFNKLFTINPLSLPLSKILKKFGCECIYLENEGSDWSDLLIKYDIPEKKKKKN